MPARACWGDLSEEGRSDRDKGSQRGRSVWEEQGSLHSWSGVFAVAVRGTRSSIWRKKVRPWLLCSVLAMAPVAMALVLAGGRHLLERRARAMAGTSSPRGKGYARDKAAPRGGDHAEVMVAQVGTGQGKFGAGSRANKN
jgi:hypothetical protein